MSLVLQSTAQPAGLAKLEKTTTATAGDLGRACSEQRRIYVDDIEVGCVGRKFEEVCCLISGQMIYVCNLGCAGDLVVRLEG